MVDGKEVPYAIDNGSIRFGIEFRISSNIGFIYGVSAMAASAASDSLITDPAA